MSLNDTSTLNMELTSSAERVQEEKGVEKVQRVAVRSWYGREGQDTARSWLVPSSSTVVIESTGRPDGFERPTATGVRERSGRSVYASAPKPSTIFLANARQRMGGSGTASVAAEHQLEC